MMDQLVNELRQPSLDLGVSNRTRTRDILDHNCGQQGSMTSRALARGMMKFIRVRLGFHGCCTSLLYWALRPQSLGKPCVMVCTRRVACTNAVAKLRTMAPVGGRCYTAATWSASMRVQGAVRPVGLLGPEPSHGHPRQNDPAREHEVSPVAGCWSDRDTSGAMSPTDFQGTMPLPADPVAIPVARHQVRSLRRLC
jgi:hypothetical protein